ncbi:unnamed protein product [Pedinophyceae sp. YPF-701]|nr:unnamed protein product [Pedinophyceae sp. YPF-701]
MIPSMLAAAQTAWELRALIRAMKDEMPRTMAVLRLSGLELADAAEEVTGLTGDLAEGVRSTANMATLLNDSVLGAPQLAKELTQDAVPAMTKLLARQVEATAKLQHTAEMLRGAKVAARRGRALMGTVGAAQWVHGVTTAGQLRAGRRRAAKGRGPSTGKGSAQQAGYA